MPYWCLILYFLAALQSTAQISAPASHYKVLPPAIRGNLAIFPVIGTASLDTGTLLTLEEGLASGRVLITGAGQYVGLTRPLPSDNSVLSEEPFPQTQRSRAIVNELVIVNHSSSPLLLLAGEIVTGRNSDRIIAEDRMIPAHSKPVALDVFSVTPHKAGGDPLKRALAEFASRLRSVRAVGAVVAVNGMIVWADVFANPVLLAKYWPKLISSYTIETLSQAVNPVGANESVTQQQAQSLLDHFDAKRKRVQTDPGIYRTIGFMSDDFDASVMTALLPNGGFVIHIAKMIR